MFGSRFLHGWKGEKKWEKEKEEMVGVLWLMQGFRWVFTKDEKNNWEKEEKREREKREKCEVFNARKGFTRIHSRLANTARWLRFISRQNQLREDWLYIEINLLMRGRPLVKYNILCPSCGAACTDTPGPQASMQHGRRVGQTVRQTKITPSRKSDRQR